MTTKDCSILGAGDDCPLVADMGADADGDADGLGDACAPCPADAANACRVDLLRWNASTSRTQAAYRPALTAGGSPVLDAVRDPWQADVLSLPSITIPGDALPVGDGNPGVIIFYELTPAPGPLRVRKSGADVVVSGW